MEIKLKRGNVVKSALIGGLSAIALALIGAKNVNADTTVTVKSGDTLNKIAADNNTTAEKIGKDNGIKNINLIYVGETFNILSQEDDVKVNAPAYVEAPAQAPEPAQTYSPVVTPSATQNVAGGGDVHAQFIANGGTEAMWVNIVMPESGGNPEITSPNGYHGLGQTKQAWGFGDIATQTRGMIAYANERYGSIDNAVAYRVANHSW